MSTIVVNPRPELQKEEAAPGQSVLASSFSNAWATIGNSYESLTIGAAPGNGARTVPAAHNHDATGTGVILAQAPTKWNGRGGVGDGLNGAATGHPFALTKTFAWAGLAIAYTDQACDLVVFVKGDFPVPWDVIPGAVSLELDGVPIQWTLKPSADPSVFMVTSESALITAGTHTLALAISFFRAGGELWQVIGAELWPSTNEQLRLPA